jgi:hypothetical protein
MNHHIRFHRRHFGRRLFAVLLVAAVVVALVWLVRRNNLRRSGVVPEPFLDDVRELYSQLLYKFDCRDYRGIVDTVFGRGPVAV